MTPSIPTKQLMRNRDFASKQLNQIQNRIDFAAKKAKRDPADIALIGASKQQPSELMQAFIEAGLRDFGENYLQEAVTKQNELGEIDINWHFIGRVQSNKCKVIARHFNWVHGVDRFKVANALANARASQDQPLNILIQLNTDSESSKAGVNITQATELCQKVAELDALRLRGFMLIPKPANNVTEQRRPFAAAREALQDFNQRYAMNLDTLSMGMSNDLEAAIAEGATMIRVGTDLFGARNS